MSYARILHPVGTHPVPRLALPIESFDMVQAVLCGLEIAEGTGHRKEFDHDGEISRLHCNRGT